MMTTILFPYHPNTGLRLTQTVEHVPATCPQDIFKMDGIIQLENASGSSMDWNSAETQAVGTDIYLADERGTQCRASEAVWSEVDAYLIEIHTPGVNSHPEMANFLRNQLMELSSAAREVILDAQQGVDTGKSSELLKALLIKQGLWEEFNPKDE